MQHRWLTTAILVPLSITLIFLGVRPVFFKIDYHPKPRPRAVVESKVNPAEEKSCQKQLKVAAVALPPAPVAAAAPQLTVAPFTQKALSPVSFLIASSVNSRAPPRLFA